MDLVSFFPTNFSRVIQKYLQVDVIESHKCIPYCNVYAFLKSPNVAYNLYSFVVLREMVILLKQSIL